MVSGRIGYGLGWAIWAVLPVTALAFHFGPGQHAAVLDRAAALQGVALSAEQEAREAQAHAYTQHLAAIDARRAAFLEGTPEADARADRATTGERTAYELAADAWTRSADAFAGIESLLTTATARDGAADDALLGELSEVRLAKSRALVRSGDVWGGITELESLLETVEPDGTDPSLAQEALALRAREELGTAYYFGARLLRLSGKPAEEWRVESGQARQQFRYLAEKAIASGAPADAADAHQKNLELVLNLEQLDLNELQASPLPRNCPCQGKEGNRPGTCKGKTKRPPERKGDARGAGGAGAIPSGW